MHEETTVHCLNPGCAHALPRPVAYCPYCGTAQSVAAGDARRAAVATAAASAAASLSGWTDAPQGEDVPAAAPRPAPGAVAPAAEAAETARADLPDTDTRTTGAPVLAEAAARAGPSASGRAPTPDIAFGHGARARQEAPPAASPVPPAAPTPAPRGWGRGPAPPPAGPRSRQPVRLRWWLLVLAVLWGVWLWAKPSARRIEKRIDAAIALAHACKAREAQDELIALQGTRATPQQLERLQQALNDEAAACSRRKRRAGSHPLAAPDN